MAVRYAKPELSVGVEAALERLVTICARDGYRLAAANLVLVDNLDGREVALTTNHGKWYELAEEREQNG